MSLRLRNAIEQENVAYVCSNVIEQTRRFIMMGCWHARTQPARYDRFFFSDRLQPQVLLGSNELFNVATSMFLSVFHLRGGLLYSTLILLSAHRAEHTDPLPSTLAKVLLCIHCAINPAPPASPWSDRVVAHVKPPGHHHLVPPVRFDYASLHARRPV
jgi:hypothetical protein